MPFANARAGRWAAVTGASLLAAAIAFVFVYPARCGRDGIAFRSAARRLNQLKNRDSTPQRADVDSGVTLEAMLLPGYDRRRWREDRAASIVGYVRYVRSGDAEAVNCYGLHPRDRDTYILLVADPTRTDSTPRVAIEVTPRWRARMRQRGEDWSTGALKARLLGRKVRATGWLLFDAPNEAASQHTALDPSLNARTTAWELHPVTGIELVVVPSGPDGAAPAAEHEN
jgi:hypothetical protein